MHVQEILEQIRSVSPHAVPVLVLSITIIFGLLIGSIRLFGLKLGVAGMLFSGIILGHVGFRLEQELLAFLKEFGLVLFVFTVGIQLGPGFFNSLKKDGIRLNGMALMVILMGALIAFGGGSLLGWKPGVMAGIFTGATTNTPALGAAQQMIALSKNDPTQSSIASMAYAVSYPFAVMGIILAFVLIRLIFRIDVAEEQRRFTDQQQRQIPSSISVTMRVDNPNLAGVLVKDVPGLGGNGVILSRIRHAGQQEVTTVTSETMLQCGDVVLAIGSEEQLKRAEMILGVRVDEDLHKAPGDVICKRVLVTNKAMIGKTIADTGIARQFGVTIARVSRQDLIMTAVGSIRLQFGDMLNLVGDEASIHRAEKVVGNSVHQLNATSFASIFLGITLGVLLGLYPWNLPWVPVPLRFGLAGGPLIVAIIMGRLGRIGPLLVHMPINANTAFRELGMILFLGCVGLGAGEKFVEIAFSQQGVSWMVMGITTTMLPLLCVGIFARKRLKMNYLTICGMLSGSMTDPPALAFANKLTNSDSASLAYANVYPMTMLTRILVVQIALLFLGV
jgi:putative transport protein